MGRRGFCFSGVTLAHRGERATVAPKGWLQSILEHILKWEIPAEVFDSDTPDDVKKLLLVATFLVDFTCFDRKN